MRKRILGTGLSALLVGGLAVGAVSTAVSAPPVEAAQPADMCANAVPAGNANCAFNVVVNDFISSTTSQVSITGPTGLPNSTVGSGDDYLVGVYNNSGQTIASLPLSGPASRFSFDNDEPHSAGVTVSGSGTVSFGANGLAAGASAFFALEGGGPTGSTYSADAPITATAVAPFGAKTNTALSNQQVATFTDPNTSAKPGDYSATIDWGDGSPVDTTTPMITGSNGSFTVTGSHTYTAATTSTPDTVTVKIIDLDNSGNNAVVQDSVSVGDTLQSCNAGQNCSATDTGTGNGAGLTSTANTNSPTKGTFVVTIGGIIDCGPGFFHAPAATWVDSPGITSATETITLVIDKSVVVKTGGGNAGLSHYAVCYDQQAPFKDINGNMVTTGILPNCSSTNPVAPCLLSKQKDPAGDVVETALALPQDAPGWY